MGTSYLADGITGISLAREEEVVVFLVSRNTAFPFDERVNEAPTYPCDLFRINSLPIFGKVNGSNGIDVNETQLGVALAVRMGGCANWAEFESKAIRGKGVPFAVKSRGQQSLQERQADARARTYGLFVVSTETFSRVKRKVRFTGEKPVRSDASLRREQVGQVLTMFDAFLEMQRFMRGEPTQGQSAAERILEDKRRRLTGLITATALEGATEYQDEAGEMVSLPMLSRAFGDGFGAIYGRDFLSLTRSVGFRGADIASDGAEVPLKAGEIPDLARFLELVWETQRLYFGMRYLNAVVTPSKAGGDRANRVDVIEMARQTIEAAFIAELTALAGFDSLPKQYKEIRLQLTRAKSTLGKLEVLYDEALVKAKAEAKAAAPESVVVRDVVETVVENVVETAVEPVTEAEVQVATLPVARPSDETKEKSKPTSQGKPGRKPKASALKDSVGDAVAEPVPEVASEPAATSQAEAGPQADADPHADASAEKDVEALKKKYGLPTSVDVPF